MKKDGVITELYGKIAEEQLNSRPYSRLLTKFVKARQKFNEQITEDQQKELDILFDILGDMCEEENKEFFTEGFVMATKIMAEAYNKDNK